MCINTLLSTEIAKVCEAEFLLERYGVVALDVL